MRELGNYEEAISFYQNAICGAKEISPRVEGLWYGHLADLQEELGNHRESLGN
jgi:hypothetical protein